MDQPYQYLTADSAALSTSYTTFALGNIPRSNHVGGLLLTIEGASTTGQSVDVRLSTDAAGDKAITTDATEVLNYGLTTATDASVVLDFDRPAIVGDGAPQVWVHVKLSTGTATGCVPTLVVRDVGR